MVDDSTQELASGIDLSSPRRRVSKCSRVSLFASEESRRKSHQESTFDITPEASTVQEEEGLINNSVCYILILSSRVGVLDMLL